MSAEDIVALADQGVGAASIAVSLGLGIDFIRRQLVIANEFKALGPKAKTIF